MADALCGPSNPLQSFQKHSQVDRTLQQDRLSSPRHSPAQGFRTPDPRAGSLDAEFAAFEAGPTNPLQFEQPLPIHGPLPAFASQPGPANWASDFQNLHVSQPISSQQFRTQAPLVRSTDGGWQNEFMRQRQGGGNSFTQEKLALRQNQSNGFGWAPQIPYTQISQPQQDVYSEQMVQEPQHGMDYSQMDFENAFANAFQDAELMNVDQTQGTSNEMYSNMLHEDGAYTNDHSGDTINHDRPLETIRIGSDTIQYTEQQDRTADQDTRDADDLARTAGQLLNSVQHDTSAKFRDSQFMALMRKIRDREVEVREEDFKPTTPDNNSFQLNAHSSKTQAMEGQSSESLRPHDPNSFQFPDLNHVYDPISTHETEQQQEDYNFAEHQFANTAFQPRSQVQALHPGGRWYPEQSPPPSASVQMSGGIAAEEFEKQDESGNLAARYLASKYRRPSVIDATPDGT